MPLFVMWLGSHLGPTPTSHSHTHVSSSSPLNPVAPYTVCPQADQPPLTSQTGGEFIAQALARNRMQSAEVAQAAAKLDAERVASEVHFVPTHLQAVTA